MLRYRDIQLTRMGRPDEQTTRGHNMRTKVGVPAARNTIGFSIDRFTIDLAADTVTYPAHHTAAAIRDCVTTSRALVRCAGLARCGPLALDPIG